MFKKIVVISSLLLAIFSYIEYKNIKNDNSKLVNELDNIKKNNEIRHQELEEKKSSNEYKKTMEEYEIWLELQNQLQDSL